jgi:hypothetical protein
LLPFFHQLCGIGSFVICFIFFLEKNWLLFHLESSSFLPPVSASSFKIRKPEFSF